MKKIVLIIGVLINLCIETQGKSTLISPIENGFEIDFQLPDFEIWDTILVDPGSGDKIFSYIHLEDFGIICDPGYPELPQLTLNIKIPENASDFKHTMQILEEDVFYVSNYILPAQEMTNTEITKFEFKKEHYQTDGTSRNKLLQLSKKYVFLGDWGINLSVIPFQYNPTRNKIRVIKKCKIILRYKSDKLSKLKSTVVQPNSNNSSALFFDNVKKTNLGSSNSENYLIITDNQFLNTLTTFINHKKNIGYNVQVTTTAVSGTTATQIRGYLQSRYNNPSTRPLFVLLVGDHENIPESGMVNDTYYYPDTDLYYTLLSGNDHYPDVYLGRFSVSTNEELENIIFKTIYMETNLYQIEKQASLLSGIVVGDTYIDRNYEQLTAESLEPSGYTVHIISGRQGATHQDGIEALNRDNSIFMYCGHGLQGSLGEPFDILISDIHSASNHTFPAAFALACFTNDFAGSTTACIGEHWIRSQHGGVSWFGATTFTSGSANMATIRYINSNYSSTIRLAPLTTLSMVDLYDKRMSTSGEDPDEVLRFLEALNLLGDPSFYLEGISCDRIEEYIFTENRIFPSGSHVTYHAAYKIVAAEGNVNFAVQNGSEVNLYAANSIRLKKGFSAARGSKFRATKKACQYPSDSHEPSEYSFKNKNHFLQPDQQSEFEQEADIKNVCTIFPNPACNHIRLYFKLWTDQLFSLSIYSIHGKKMLEMSLEEYDAASWNEVVLDISAFEIGNYIYQLDYNGGCEKGSFLKVK